MNDMEHDSDNVRRGAVISPEGKTRITLYLDDDILDHCREVATRRGRGYQTVINEVLREAMCPCRETVTVATTRSSG